MPAPALALRRPAAARPLRIGYVPLTDCAPLIVAHELGLFARHGLRVQLRREAGWASVREKMLHGELDASQAPVSMVFEMSWGLGVVPVSTLTGLVTAHNGNAITLSNELWDLGVRDAHSLRQTVDRLRGQRRFTFAGVLHYSSQHYLMRKWLRSGGLRPEEDVDITMLPPPQVHTCLREGHIDGYCVAEPWSSAGLRRGIGWCVTLTADLDPMHPEKVFMVRENFERERHDEHVRLIAALIEAARYCDLPRNRGLVAALLAQPNYIGVPRDVLENALIGPFRMGMDRECDATRAIVFHRDDAGRPAEAKARWVLDEIAAHGLGRGLPRLTGGEIREHFREDLYDEALALASAPPRSTATPAARPVTLSRLLTPMPSPS